METLGLNAWRDASVPPQRTRDAHSSTHALLPHTPLANTHTKSCIECMKWVNKEKTLKKIRSDNERAFKGEILEWSSFKIVFGRMQMNFLTTSVYFENGMVISIKSLCVSSLMYVGYKFSFTCKYAKMSVLVIFCKKHIANL